MSKPFIAYRYYTQKFLLFTGATATNGEHTVVDVRHDNVFDVTAALVDVWANSPALRSTLPEVFPGITRNVDVDALPILPAASDEIQNANEFESSIDDIPEPTPKFFGTDEEIVESVVASDEFIDQRREAAVGAARLEFEMLDEDAQRYVPVATIDEVDGGFYVTVGTETYDVTQDVHALAEGFALEFADPQYQDDPGFFSDWPFPEYFDGLPLREGHYDVSMIGPGSSSLVYVLAEPLDAPDATKFFAPGELPPLNAFDVAVVENMVSRDLIGQAFLDEVDDTTETIKDFFAEMNRRIDEVLDAPDAPDPLRDLRTGVTRDGIEALLVQLDEHGIEYAVTGPSAVVMRDPSAHADYIEITIPKLETSSVEGMLRRQLMRVMTGPIDARGMDVILQDRHPQGGPSITRPGERVPDNVDEFVSEHGLVRAVVAPIFEWRDLAENATLVQGSDPESPPRLVQVIDGPDDLGGPTGGQPAINPTGRPPSEGPVVQDDRHARRVEQIRAALSDVHEQAGIDALPDEAAPDNVEPEQDALRPTPRAILQGLGDGNGLLDDLDAADGGGLNAV